MKPSERDIYRALDYYMSTNREKLARIFLKNKRHTIKPSLEKRLTKLGYIEHSIAVNQENMHYDDLIITNKGYDKFCELRNQFQKDWSFLLTITNIIVAILTIILFSKSMGWW